MGFGIPLLVHGFGSIVLGIAAVSGAIGLFVARKRTAVTTPAE